MPSSKRLSAHSLMFPGPSGAVILVNLLEPRTGVNRSARMLQCRLGEPGGIDVPD
jgi:hypothetical protein